MGGRTMKVRKKPVEVEVVKFLGVDQGFEERPDWLLKAIYMDEKIRFFGTADKLDIDTLEGTMQASKGDYIIKGVNGELYSCKPDVFNKTYDIVSD